MPESRKKLMVKKLPFQNLRKENIGTEIIR